MEAILIPLAFFAAIVLIVYIVFAGRNKERIALINKGVGATIFDRIPQSSLFSLKIGFFFIGIGIGCLIGNVVAINTPLQEEVAYFSMILLFGGLSLIIFHLLEKKFLKNLNA